MRMVATEAQMKEQLRTLLVALKRSIDPHQSDSKRYEILRADFDPIWADLTTLCLSDETSAPLTADRIAKEFRARANDSKIGSNFVSGRLKGVNVYNALHWVADEVLRIFGSPVEPSRPLTGGTPIDEYIAELEKDPTMKAKLDEAREKIRRNSAPEMTGVNGKDKQT
jgi:hypothetical protein